MLTSIQESGLESILAGDFTIRVKETDGKDRMSFFGDKDQTVFCGFIDFEEIDDEEYFLDLMFSLNYDEDELVLLTQEQKDKIYEILSNIFPFDNQQKIDGLGTQMLKRFISYMKRLGVKKVGIQIANVQKLGRILSKLCEEGYLEELELNVTHNVQYYSIL